MAELVKTKNVALALSSGGARGLAHIGAIEELEAQGYHISSIAGCSMGALIGGVYAAGKLNEFREWMKTIDRKKMLGLIDFSLSLNHLVKGTRIIEAIMEFVPDVNIEDLPCISTGFTELDRTLTGGFHYGGVVIVSGKRGDGKSTMASQFVAEALRQDHNCMIYSGELPNVHVKNWLDRQIIGKRDLSESDVSRCNAWYKGRLFVYDDTDLTDEDDETGALMEIMEEAIIQKNCEMILTDNLMTAMEEGAETNEALYRKQSDFVGRMAKMARRLKVIIILVAHPRKTLSTALTNDDVSGSADITNKANLVLTYSRITHNGEEPDPTVRALAITKNRLTGKLGSIKVYFNEDSKRISDNSLNFERKYIESDDFEDLDDMAEIPC